MASNDTDQSDFDPSEPAGHDADQSNTSIASGDGPAGTSSGSGDGPADADSTGSGDTDSTGPDSTGPESAGTGTAAEAGTAGPELDGSSEPARPVKAKRAPRKSSRNAAAPLPATVADPFGLGRTDSASAGTEAALDSGDAASEAPARAKRTRKTAKRAAKKAGAPEQPHLTEAGSGAAASDAANAVLNDDLASGATPPSVTDGAADAPRDTEREPAPDYADDAAWGVPGGDVEEHSGGDADDSSGDVAEGTPVAEQMPHGSADPAPAAPAFGVLFQAPEAAPIPRRRRASSPATAPSPHPPASQHSGADIGRDDLSSEGTETAAGSDAGLHGTSGRHRGDQDAGGDGRGDQDRADQDRADQDRGDQGSSGREPVAEAPDGPTPKRRRRGGKGRRGRSLDSAGEDGAEEDLDPSTPHGRGNRADDGPNAVGDRSDAGSESADTATSAGVDDVREDDDDDGDSDSDGPSQGASRRRTRRRRRGGADDGATGGTGGGGSGGSSASGSAGRGNAGGSTRVRDTHEQDSGERSARDEVTSVRGSTRLEAKKQRRREGREAGRRRTVITEAEFLARRESVERVMVVRHKDDRTQIAVLEDGILVEHYVSRETNASLAGNVYVGRIQNVLPSMEAAFIDVGRGRNAVLYAGEVNWDAAGLDSNRPKRIENALKSGESVLVQVTKDPMGHKGARLTSQISLPGRYLVYVPGANMTGISRKLPDTERARLKRILREVVPDHAGVIVRTAAEGASEDELRADVTRLTAAWEDIQAKAKTLNAPALVHGEPDLTVRVIRDVFNEDFSSLVASGEPAWEAVSGYVNAVAPDLADRLTRWTSEQDAFTHYRVDEQLAKALDRKVWLPSGGSLVIDRTEAMTVVDVNTGKFIGSGGNLEETVTKNNIEAAEEIVRQLRLRDIGGIIVIDFIDMVLESNRDLVVRRLTECLGRDRTKHQVAEVTSLGLVQMTRKRVGSGLLEIFSEPCEHCGGRGFIVQSDPVDHPAAEESDNGTSGRGGSRGGRRGGRPGAAAGRDSAPPPLAPAPTQAPSTGPTAAQIAAKAHAAAIHAASLSSSQGTFAAAGELAAPEAAQAAAADRSGEIVAAAMAEPGDPGAAQTRDPAQESDSEVVEGAQGAEGAAGSDDAQGADLAEGAEVTHSSELAERDHRSEAPGEPGHDSESGQEPETLAHGLIADSVGPSQHVAAAAPNVAAAAPRGRRRRGRVVAPAGPPRAHPQSGDGQDNSHEFGPDGTTP